MNKQSIVEKIIENIKTTGSADESIITFQRLPKEDKTKLLISLKNKPDETAGAYLNALYVAETDKEIQKQIRKSIFTLKTMGIKIEDTKTPGKPVLRRVEEIREHRALMSNYDIEHMRLIVASYELKKNNFIFFNAALSFTKGLFKLMSGPVDKTRLKDLMKEHPGDKKGNMIMVNISPVYAAYLMEEAAIRSGKHKEEISKLNQFVATMTNDIRKPENIYSLPVPETTGSLSMEKILQHPALEPFSLEWKTFEDDKKTYNNIGSSAIILPPYMVEEKKNAFIEQILEFEEIKSRLPLIKRLLEDYAYIFHSLNEFSYYKGLMEHIHDMDVLRNTLIYFIKKVLEKSEEKQPGIIKSPYG